MKTQVDWIPVEREMPLQWINVLFAAETIRMGYLGKSGWCEAESERVVSFSDSVTHWAHLPEHPNAKSQP